MAFRPVQLNFGMDDAGNVAVQMPNGSWQQLMDQRAGNDNSALAQDPVVFDSGSKTLFANRQQIALPVARYGTTPFAQSAVPTILLSSATAITATGAITGLTALPYVPTGVVRVYCFAQTGLAAGLYYAKFTSVTDCQLYTNAAATTTPTGITAGAYAGGTGAAILWSTTLPAGSLGPNGALAADVLWSGSNTANTRNTGVALASIGFCANGWSGVASLRHNGVLRNRGAQNVQVYGNVNSGVAIGGGPQTVSQMTVDTSQAQTLAITAQLSNAADFAILEGFTIEVMYGA